MSLEIFNNVGFREKIVSNAERLLNFDVRMYEEDDHLIIDKKFNGCLAFVKYVLVESGITIPNYIGVDGVTREIKYVNEMFDHFGVYVEYGQHRSGDILCFSRLGERPQHIGIVVNDNYYIHAPARKGVVCKDKIEIESIEKTTPNSIYTQNPIGFKRPFVSTDHPRWFQSPIR